MTHERPKRRKQAKELREADYRALVEESPAVTYVQELGEPGLMRHLSSFDSGISGRLARQERHPGASPRTMYINLSARQFNDPGLIEAVTKAVREAGVEPGSLALEIAESVLMSDAQSAVVKLRALTAPCVRLEPYARRAISNQPSAISKNKKLTAES